MKQYLCVLLMKSGTIEMVYNKKEDSNLNLKQITPLVILPIG